LLLLLLIAGDNNQEIAQRHQIAIYKRTQILLISLVLLYVLILYNFMISPPNVMKMKMIVDHCHPIAIAIRKGQYSKKKSSAYIEYEHGQDRTGQEQA
jgi:hypothetical protein